MYFVLLKNDEPIKITESKSEAQEAMSASLSMTGDEWFSLRAFSSFQEVINFLSIYAEKVESQSVEKPESISTVLNEVGNEFQKIVTNVVKNTTVKDVVSNVQTFFTNVLNEVKKNSK